MNEDETQKGELFSRLYVERGAPVQDKRSFRVRLAEQFKMVVKDKPVDFTNKIESYIRKEGGKDMPNEVLSRHNVSNYLTSAVRLIYWT